MRRARLVTYTLSWSLAIGLMPLLALGASPAGPTGASKIDKDLADELVVAGQANFWIDMAEQADLQAAYDMDWHTRGWYVYETLTETARRSQTGVAAYLETRGLAFDSYWINNSIYVHGGNLAAVRDLAARHEVKRIKADGAARLPEPAPDTGAIVQGLYNNWGLDWVHAPEAWALGYDGSGIVVATIDTGVQYDHPQLDDTYRGAIDGTNQYNWCDPSGICPGDAPCDNYGHGTHVMGILSGENDDPIANPNLIGIAPASTWIACKGCESDSCSDRALAECAQWIAAPTELTRSNCGSRPNSTPNPDKRPHIVNSSWGDTESDPWYQAFVQAWRAFGIFPAFSAGNQNSCGSVGSPGDYPESFSSANVRSDGTINPAYSSRGPGSIGSVAYCKPNIAAPGTDIASAYPGNGYSIRTGTSMASPHSAGAVALLWQACPALIGRVDLTFQSLQDSTRPAPEDPCAATPGCLDADCNCTYGYGYLDVYNAIEDCSGLLHTYYFPVVYVYQSQ